MTYPPQPAPELADILRLALSGLWPPATPVEALLDRLEGRK